MLPRNVDWSLLFFLITCYIRCRHVCSFSSVVNLHLPLNESNLNLLLTATEWSNLIGPYTLPDKSISLAAAFVTGNKTLKTVSINATDFGQHFSIQLERNNKIIDPNFLLLIRTENATRLVQKELSELKCFYRNVPTSPYFAALDICNGLKGIIVFNLTEYYTINPLPQRLWTDPFSIPHILVKLNPDNYRHDGIKNGPLSFNQKHNNFKRRRKRNVRPYSHFPDFTKLTGAECGNSFINRGASANETDRRRRKRIAQKPVLPSEVFIEIAVFIDRDLYNHMKTNFPSDTEGELMRFVLALINAVELLYHDPSLGLIVNFVLKRLEILYAEPNGLIRSHDIDRFLSNFCNWQHTENPVSDDDPLHWDHAVILTGLDLYVMSKNGKISNQVVGLAPVAGMCTTTSSCTVNEGRHFESAYVVAHEIGHNLGMRHDGVSADNSCDPSGYLMSPTLGSGKITWSVCSRRYLERFLESKQSECLMDKGITSDSLDHRADGVLPGERFDAHQQCKLKYGNDSFHSPTQLLEEVCKDLHCSKDRYTWSSHPALEGTKCGSKKWCRSGRCVEKGLSAMQAGYAPNQVVNGGWSKWSIFSDCASSCLYGSTNGLFSGSTGIMLSARRCNNPRPENGGELCSGSDQKYRTCTAAQCSTVKKITLTDFANELCSRAKEMDAELTGFGNHRISSDPAEACSVWCFKTGGGYKSRGSYPDGTVCQIKRNRRSTYCIKGICREFTCNRNSENVIYSHSEEFCLQQSKLISNTSYATTKTSSTTESMTSSPTTSTALMFSVFDDSSFKDKRKPEPAFGEWIASSTCFYNCIVPGVGIKLVEKKLCPHCNVTINVQSCQPFKQVCGRIRSIIEHATIVCNKYSQRVRRLSGIGMQLSKTNDDPHRPCRLACQDESISHRFYMVNGEDGWFPFGTDCTRGDTTRKAYCINGKCLEFGQDNTPQYDFIYSLPLMGRIKRNTFNQSLPVLVDPAIKNTLQDIIHYLKYGQYLNVKKEENKFPLDFLNPINVNKEEVYFDSL